MIPVDTAGCLFLPRVQYAQKAYVIGCVCVYMSHNIAHLASWYGDWWSKNVQKSTHAVLMLLSFHT